MKPAYHFSFSDVRELVTFLRCHALDTLERTALAPKEFTALLPLVDDGTAESLGSLDRGLRQAMTHLLTGPDAALQRVASIHAARAVILPEPNARTGTEGHATARCVLLLSMICDGWPLDVLEELDELAGEELAALLQHCEGYPAEASQLARVDFLRRHRLRSAYMFADNRRSEPHMPHMHASAAEVLRALELRRNFVKLIAETTGMTPAEQQLAFEHFRQQRPAPGQPAPSAVSRRSPRESQPAWAYPTLERPALEQRVFPGPACSPSAHELALDDEGHWIRRTTEVVRARARRDIRRRKREGITPAGLRQVHAKHHGLMRALFEVERTLPSLMQQGVFVAGGSYEALIRVSSTNPTVAADYIPDGRGCAIKLLNASKRGPLALAAPLPDPMPDGDSNGYSQDFVLVSNPTFFLKDARDYAVMRGLMDARPDGLTEKMIHSAATLSFGLRRRREIRNFLQTLRIPRHPLSLQYHSMVPILIGPNIPAKISVRPSTATLRILTGEALGTSLQRFFEQPQDYLRRALQRSLDDLGTTPLVLELIAHVPHEQTLPIENPLIDWDQLGCQQVLLGTLTVQAQDATSQLLCDMAEKMIFTPWHALAAHRPLGSLNRARLTVYQASAEERARANGLSHAYTAAYTDAYTDAHTEHTHAADLSRDRNGRGTNGPVDDMGGAHS